MTDGRNEHAMVAWRVNNRERYNEYHRNYYHAHKDELSEKRKARYAANREQIKIKRMMAYRRKKEVVAGSCTVSSRDPKNADVCQDYVWWPVVPNWGSKV